MAVHIKVSNSACLLLGAALGVTIALIAPSCDPDDKKNQENNNNELKNAATNTSKVNEEKSSKYYGDRTVSDILEKAKIGIFRVWDRVEGWRVVFLNSKASSTISSDVFVDAQSSFPKTNDLNNGMVDPISDPIDTNNISTSTIYTPVGTLNISQRSSTDIKLKRVLNEMAKGYKRSSTSKNDSICKHFPRQSTLIESEHKTSIEENAVDENIETANESDSISRNDKDKRLVLSFRTPFSPVIKVFQAVKRFKRAKKRGNERTDPNAEINNDNIVQEAVAT